MHVGTEVLRCPSIKEAKSSRWLFEVRQMCQQQGLTDGANVSCGHIKDDCGRQSCFCDHTSDTSSGHCCDHYATVNTKNCCRPVSNMMASAASRVMSGFGESIMRTFVVPPPQLVTGLPSGNRTGGVFEASYNPDMYGNANTTTVPSNSPRSATVPQKITSSPVGFQRLSANGMGAVMAPNTCPNFRDAQIEYDRVVRELREIRRCALLQGYHVGDYFYTGTNGMCGLPGGLTVSVKSDSQIHDIAEKTRKYTQMAIDCCKRQGASVGESYDWSKCYGNLVKKPTSGFGAYQAIPLPGWAMPPEAQVPNGGVFNQQLTRNVGTSTVPFRRAR